MGSFSWLTQGIAANIVYGLLLLAGGVVLAYLRAIDSRWLGVTAYGLAGIALIGIIIASTMVIWDFTHRPR